MTVTIARCPAHGLHGERDECFVCAGPVDKVPMVPLEQLLGDKAIEQHARRLFGRSAASPYACAVLPEVLDEAWERLTEPMQTSFRAQARQDLESAIAAAEDHAA